jgi:hypothetical protein
MTSTAEIIPFKEPRSLAGLAAKLPAVFLPDERAAERFFGFFTANIRNRNTRRAYYKAAGFRTGARAGDCWNWRT